MVAVVSFYQIIFIKHVLKKDDESISDCDIIPIEMIEKKMND